jgi:hypothetical protein
MGKFGGFGGKSGTSGQMYITSGGSENPPEEGYPARPVTIVTRRGYFVDEHECPAHASGLSACRACHEVDLQYFFAAQP